MVDRSAYARAAKRRISAIIINFLSNFLLMGKCWNMGQLYLGSRGAPFLYITCRHPCLLGGWRHEIWVKRPAAGATATLMAALTLQQVGGSTPVPQYSKDVTPLSHSSERHWGPSAPPAASINSITVRAISFPTSSERSSPNATCPIDLATGCACNRIRIPGPLARQEGKRPCRSGGPLRGATGRLGPK